MKTHLYPGLLSTVLIAGLMFTVSDLDCNAQGTSFNGFEFALPATIECEQFNRGGVNVAYSAPYGLPNTKYRDEGVAIYRCSDYDGIRGYCLKGWQGNWFRYSITTAETATYRIEVRARRVAAQYSGSFRLQIEGGQYTDMTVNGAIDGWQTLTGTISITAGSHILKFEMTSGDATLGVGLFDYITLYKAPASINNPTYQVSANLLPGTSLTIAKTNGLRLQEAFDALPTSGGQWRCPAEDFTSVR